MVAIEFFHDAERTRPAPELAKALVAEAFQRQLLLLSCGTYGNVIRLMTPLTLSDALLEEGLDVLDASLRAVLAAKN
jgi:4-aminobutyrate aminotransferase/4-aminobutyrate aminotransferase/(S)-3-amino-2-methylpropionate transaminase